MTLRCRRFAALAGMLAVNAVAADPGTTRFAELVDLELEQLTRITVTSASRFEERLVDTAASIFVITGEDIRRSGATSLPEALRLAPNLQVQRADANQYVASARGGLTSTANKMLVLVDGRTIYTPLFSGVFWEAHDLLLADIERIEVISGPGSTLWGTNAVNGLISITTKRASATRGALVTGVGGDLERGIAARAGAVLGEHADYRVYAKYWERDALKLASGASAADASERRQAGFRGDWASGGSKATLQGDVYSAQVDTLGGRRDISGGNVLGRWSSALQASDVTAQAYFDRAHRDHVGSFRETRDTFHVEAQQDLRRRGDHRLVWGASYAWSSDDTEQRPAISFLPASKTLTTAALFAQDEWSFASRWKATFGARLERNNYTGLEWLPNARLSWAPDDARLVWMSLSRTVRSPSRIDRDAVVPGVPPYVLANNDSFEGETANVAELGYRARLQPGTSLSLTAFHHRFHGLRIAEPTGGHVVFANGADARVSGLEGWLESILTPDWRVTAGFTAMRESTALEPGRASADASPYGNNPRRTYSLRSLWNVTRAHEVDVAWRYVSSLPDPVVPSYSSLDLRLGWQASRNLEVSAVVQNVLDRAHAEFGPEAARGVIGRSWFVRVTFSPW
jgi:iron complex outermembrane recepter protein